MLNCVAYVHMIVHLGRKLFGDGYSGLEYDYRGLLRLYNAQGNSVKAGKYSTILHDWNVLRDRMHSVDYDAPLQFVTDRRHNSLHDVMLQFLSIPDRNSDIDTAASCPTWRRHQQRNSRHDFLQTSSLPRLRLSPLISCIEFLYKPLNVLMTKI